MRDLDPAVERVILRCLEQDPRMRPASALAVAAALPGGDPLAAALAAGETPSPEMVAAAGQVEGLRTRTAGILLAVTVAALALVPVLAQRTHLAGLVDLEKPPAALEDRAREALHGLGQTTPAADRAMGYGVDADYLQHIDATRQSADRWSDLRNGPVVLFFWYRESPQPLNVTAMSGHASWTNPPPLVSSMAGVRLDMEGRLVGFYAVTPQVDEASPPVEADWSVLFAQARLDPSRFTRASPRWTPPFHVDSRVAWTGTDPTRPDLSLRLEAASYRGRPVYFEMVEPWTRADRMEVFRFTGGQKAAFRLGIALLLSLTVTSLLVARHNVRLGRGDRRGARRVAVVALCARLAAWALGAHHVADVLVEIPAFVRGLSAALVVAATVWILYLALEPFLRRNWPETLVSWARLLAGRFRDPVVGRDLLIGAVAGSLVTLAIDLSRTVIPARLGLPIAVPIAEQLDVLLGTRLGIASLADVLVLAVLNGMGLVLLRLGLRKVLRWEPLVAAVFALLMSLAEALVAGPPSGPSSPWPSWPRAFPSTSSPGAGPCPRPCASSW